MNLLQNTFRRGGKDATLYHANSLSKPTPPEGRSSEEFCAHCGGLFGTITVKVQVPPKGNDNRRTAQTVVVECSEDDLRAFQRVGYLTGVAPDVVRRHVALVNTQTGDRYCTRCVG